jgi:hypothetical protein
MDELIKTLNHIERHRRSSELKYEVNADIEPYIVDAWLEKNVGPEWDALKNRHGVWSVLWAGPRSETKYVYSFAEERDAVFFALRWL